jgi:hypothetical protein
VLEAATPVAPFNRQQAEVMEADGKVDYAVAGEISRKQLVGSAKTGWFSRCRGNAQGK